MRREMNFWVRKSLLFQSSSWIRGQTRNINLRLRPARSEAGREYELLDELIYSEQLDFGKSHLLILARTYFQDFVWSGRKETQPGRCRCQEEIEKEGGCKNKEASAKQGRRTKKPSYAVVQVSDNSVEKETEAGNAQSAMAKANRSRSPSKKVLGNAEQNNLVCSLDLFLSQLFTLLLGAGAASTPVRLHRRGSARAFGAQAVGN
eukprot:g56333.t1